MLSDHDSVSGFSEAQAAAQGRRLDLYCGVEINTRHGENVHILGYGIRAQDPRLLEALAEFRELVQSLARAAAPPAPALPEATGAGAKPSTAAQRRRHVAEVRQQLAGAGPLFHREDGSTVDPVAALRTGT